MQTYGYELGTACWLAILMISDRLGRKEKKRNGLVEKTGLKKETTRSTKEGSLAPGLVDTEGWAKLKKLVQPDERLSKEPHPRLGEINRKLVQPEAGGRRKRLS